MHIKTDQGALLSFALIFLLGTCFTFPNLGGAGLSLPFNNVVWLAAILFICITAMDVCKKEIWVKPDNALIHLLLILAMILPLLWNPDITNHGLMRMTAVITGVIFFLSLFSSFTTNREKILLTIIAGSGLIQAIWGAIQIFFLDTGLPEGIFQQPNVMASFLVTTFIVSLMLLRKACWKNEQTLKVIVIPISFFSFLVGLIITTLNSNTAYLCLFVALSLMVIVLRKSAYKIYYPLLFLFAGAVAGLAHGDWITSSGVGDILGLGSDDVSSGRLDIWKVSWAILKDNWLPGIGYGNYEQYFHEYLSRLYWQSGLIAYATTDHPHNELMLWGIEGGILPLTALFLYAAYTFWRIIRIGEKVFPYAVMLIPLVTHALLEYPFYHSILHFFLFLTLLFLFEQHAGTVSEVKFNQKKHYKILIAILFCIASAFFITNLHASFIIKNFYETDINSRELDSLAKIINPVSVQLHIDYAVLNTLLTGVEKTRDMELMQQFVEHVNHMLNNHPRAELYVALLEGYSVFNDSDNYDKIKETAHYYYPTDVHFMDTQSNNSLK